MNLHLAFGQHDGLAPARACVRALAADLDGGVSRRALADLAERQRDRLGRENAAGDLALGVAGARAGAEPCGHLVGLRQRHEEALERRRGSDKQDQ
jgi:hypothetical protein